MREKDRKLKEQCEKWARFSLDAEQWLKDNEEQVGGECDLLRRDMRKAARAFRRYAIAASRKMCIGVFGPSQAGKSYLVSALACDQQGNLDADFSGRRVGFLKEINPEGGKESTGLVTRFTTTPPAGISAERPIRLRLFTEMDLVRVFANTYYADCKHEEAPDQEQLIARIRALEQAAGDTVQGDAGTGRVTADDVEELRDYLQKNFGDQSRVQMLRDTYWVRAMELAPRLGLGDRARLFGCIWNNVPEFDRYYLTLVGALESLGFANEANCPLEALLPREKSIIDVALLHSSAEGAMEELPVEGVGGNIASLPRCVVTALTAEITIYMPRKPAPFFDYTDLLDFPGYRSREKVLNLETALGSDNWLLEKLFLRGKVAYLFERYCEDQELTGMLLCIAPSNQEVKDLPGTVDNWIRLTQGKEPADRRKHAPTLFFILTQIDREFDDKAGVEDVSNRWEVRLASSLTDFFGTQYTWPENWDGQPFRNLYLLRNPKYLCHALFDFSEDGRELGIRPDRSKYVEEIHQAFINSPSVRRHFYEPEANWQAAMRLNDGGISLLREKIEPICDLDSKYVQTHDRSFEEAKRTADRLAPYYRSDDLAKLLAQKKVLAKQLLTMLAHVVAGQHFADLLRRLQVSDHVLYEMAFESAQAAEDTTSSANEVVGGAIDADDLLGDLLGDMGDSPAPARPEEPRKEEETHTGRDQVEIFCRRALNFWFEKMRHVATSPAVQKMCNTTPGQLEAFVSEMVQSARHARLLETMTQSIREASAFHNITRDVAAWRMASEAAYRINSFVAWLGHDARLGETVDIVYNGAPARLFAEPKLAFGEHGEPIVPEQPSPYDRPYYMDWLKAFYDRVTTNLTDAEEGFDIAQNGRLGDILGQLDPQRV